MVQPELRLGALSACLAEAAPKPLVAREALEPLGESRGVTLAGATRPVLTVETFAAERLRADDGHRHRLCLERGVAEALRDRAVQQDVRPVELVLDVCWETGPEQLDRVLEAVVVDREERLDHALLRSRLRRRSGTRTRSRAPQQGDRVQRRRVALHPVQPSDAEDPERALGRSDFCRGARPA